MRRYLHRAAAALALLLAGGALAEPAPQAPRGRPAFRAAHYEVHATLVPAEHLLSARARVEFLAQTPSRNLEVELHPNLRLTAVEDAAGKPVPFDRHPERPLLVRVTLPDVAGVNDKVTLVFHYSGPLYNEEFSPVAGSIVARIDPAGSFLLQPARWFPLTDFPGNRYTSVFHLAVPEDVVVAGTGRAAPPVAAEDTPPAPPGKARVRVTAPPAAPVPPRVVYTFRSAEPDTAGSFVAGDIRMAPVSASGLRFHVYLPAAAARTAEPYARAAADIADFFSDAFGPLPLGDRGPAEPHLTLIQMPDATLHGFSAPGAVFIPARRWDASNTRLLARLLAGQWWGSRVVPASPNDAWIGDGLARYSEGLYVEHTAGREGFLRALEDFAVGAMMYEESAPVAQAGRLDLYGSEYRSVVLNKGAMIFHMLRAQLGDDTFRATLRAFHQRFAGKTATLADFEQTAQQTLEERTPAGQTAETLRPFFSQWLNSTGIPEFEVEYVVLRTARGFRVVGKVKHNLETFRMPIEIRVDTDGNPETATFQVVGSNADFSMDTFGRPRPAGVILDPNNHLLKSSPRLRVRAAVARGEEMAEQGRFFEALQHYQYALELHPANALAHFRMGEAFFYQKNYQAAANAFRDAQAGEIGDDNRWIEVWSYIYIGKIFDVSGQRDRALNEYSKAKATNDDTGGAQAEVDRLLAEPFREDAARRPGD